MSDRQELKEAFERALAERQQREAEKQPPAAELLQAVSIPEGYERENWPFKWCDYEQAGGFITRMRTAGRQEVKAIAQEFGVHPSSIKRAVVWHLKSKGEYAPKEWDRYEKARRAEGRRRFLAIVRERDRRIVSENAEINSSRDALAEDRRVRELERELHGEPHIASSYDSEAESKERRRRLQRKLNARNRARAGF